MWPDVCNSLTIVVLFCQVYPWWHYRHDIHVYTATVARPSTSVRLTEHASPCKDSYIVMQDVLPHFLIKLVVGVVISRDFR